jgi:hypothetical protein
MTADSSDSLRVLALHRDYAFGEQDGCLIVVWRGQPTEESYEERGRFMADLVGRLRGRCAVIDVVEPSSKPPSPAARKVVARLMKEVGDAVSGAAIVVEGNELRSALVRAVLAGMQLLIRLDHPIRVDKDPLRAAEWARERMQSKDATLAKRLVESIETLRARIPRG